ncbi:stalk domain-containing protein [Lawsonibacter sp. LCP25S3_F5]
MKNVFRTALCAAVMTAAVCVPTFAVKADAPVPAKQGDFYVLANDQYVTFTDAVPQIRDSRSYLPMATVFDQLGFKDIQWNDAQRSVTAAKDGVTVKLVIGSPSIALTKDGKTTTITTDVAPYIDAATSRTYVPFGLVADALGYKVGWDADQKAVIIDDVDAILADNQATYQHMDDYMAYAKTFTQQDQKVTGSYSAVLDVDSEDADIGPMNVDATLKGDYTMIQQGQSAVQFKTGMTADAKIAINGQDVTQAILGDTGVKLPLSLDVELRGDVTSGLFYVNMTGLSDLTGIPDQTWYKMDLKSMFDQMSDTTGMSYDTLMQLSAASADQGFQQTLADILKNAPVTSVNGTTADMLRQLNDMMADSSFKKSGSDYVSTMTEDGATVKFTLNYSGNKVVGYAVDMKADMDDMGSMTMTVGMKDKTLNANMAFTVDDGEGSLVKLTMTMDGAYQATSQKPNTQPPAGAQIVDLLGDVEGR